MIKIVATDVSTVVPQTVAILSQEDVPTVVTPAPAQDVQALSDVLIPKQNVTCVFVATFASFAAENGKPSLREKYFEYISFNLTC